MMKGKKKLKYLLIPLGLLALGLFGYISFVITQKPCSGDGWPAPGPSPLKFGPYYMVTDQGRLYIGQTYNHQNEGPWVGNLTLLFQNNKGATFLIRYPQGEGRDYKILKCKLFYPRTPRRPIMSGRPILLQYISVGYAASVTPRTDTRVLR